MIDLGHLREIKLNSDKSVVSVGAGSTWEDVYTYLADKGVMMPGGRVPQLGVGGFTLGGLPTDSNSR